MFRPVLRFLFWPCRLLMRRPITCLAVILLIIAVVAPAGTHLWALHEYPETERLLEDDRLPEAAQHLSFCLAVWPWSADAHFLAVRVARNSGAYAEAEAQLAECRKLEHGPSARAQLETYLLRAQRGDVENVEVGLMYQAEQDKPHEREILETLARGNMKLMRFPLAVGYLNRCLAEYPDDVRALDWRGWIMEKMQREESAVKDYERALELAPGRIEVRIRLATLYLGHSDPVLAQPHLEYLEKTHPQERISIS